MAWNVASTSWVSVLQPGTANIGVFLIDDMLHILQHFLDVIRIHDPGHAGADRQDSYLAGIGPMQHNVWFTWCQPIVTLKSYMLLNATVNGGLNPNVARPSTVAVTAKSLFTPSLGGILQGVWEHRPGSMVRREPTHQGFRIHLDQLHCQHTRQ